MAAFDDDGRRITQPRALDETGRYWLLQVRDGSAFWRIHERRVSRFGLWGADADRALLAALVLILRAVVATGAAAVVSVRCERLIDRIERIGDVDQFVVDRTGDFGQADHGGEHGDRDDQNQFGGNDEA